jgi:hypothetical protein
MKPVILIIGVAILTAWRVEASTNSLALVQVDSTDFGDTNCFMKIVEVERNANTSKLKLTYQKLGSSVGSSMFICRGFYEVAKARGAEYFINLKEWDDPNGGRVFIAGVTNTKDADLKKEFGEEFDYETEHHQKRGYMSVSQFKMVFERQEKSIEQSAPANGASPRR